MFPLKCSMAWAQKHEKVMINRKLEKQRPINTEMIQFKISLWKRKKKCDKSNQDLGKNDPNAYRANALSRHSLREPMINMFLLLLRTQYQTAVLSKHNLVVWSTKTFFLSMETWSLHKPLLVCSGSPQAPILNYDRTRLRTGKLDMEAKKNNCRVADNSWEGRARVA